MTDQIKPALTAEEWAALAADPSYEPRDHSVFSTSKYLPDEHRLAAIAYLNFLLPDDDPRKLNRDDVQQLRFIADRIDETHHTAGESPLRIVAAKLEALLPPR